jgi:hypothetical protein
LTVDLVPGEPSGDNDFDQLRRQASVYSYHCATLLEVFTSKLDETQTAVGRENAHHPRSFDSLAKAKQALAVHPQLAWLMLDDFRKGWGLDLRHAPEQAESILRRGGQPPGLTWRISDD